MKVTRGQLVYEWNHLMKKLKKRAPQKRKENSSVKKIKSNPSISIIGYISEEKEGCHLITRGGNRHALIAQGWNHMKGG